MKCTNCGIDHNAKFCPECGTTAQQSRACASCGAVHSAKFCPECGVPVGGTSPQPAAQPAPVAPAPVAQKAHFEEITLWEGKPAGIVDKLKGAVHEKLNDQKYKITNQRIIISAGLLKKVEGEIELRHVKDINVKQSITERIAKVGDIIITSADPTLGNFFLNNVSDPVAVKEIIRKAVMDMRANINIVHHEM